MKEVNETNVKQDKSEKKEPEPPRVLIKDLSEELTEVNLTCKIISIKSKEFTRKGYKGTRYYGILEDRSGSISFSAFRHVDFEKGEVVHISKAIVRQWQGVLNINIAAKTEISKVTDEKILQKFQKSTPAAGFRRTVIKSFRPGLDNISCTCRVVSVEPVGIKVNEKTKTVYKGVVADITGSIRFTAWTDFELEKGAAVDIQGATVKPWKKFLELNMNSNTKVKFLSDENIPTISEMPVEIEIPINELYEKKFLSTPEFIIRGTILEFKKGSGVISRCSACGRAVQNGECLIHGRTDLRMDLRLRAIMDDGTGAVTVFFNKNLSEKLIGKSLEECLKQISKWPDIDKANEGLLSNLLVQDLRVKGNLIGDDVNISIYATWASYEPFDDNATRMQAEEMLEVMG